ncbi:MAG: hypothetical protein P1U56_20575 [Saprospiraceae bacterium]|nr:hypothetical protein [Saprospiraceae bacterium]
MITTSSSSINSKKVIALLIKGTIIFFLLWILYVQVFEKNDLAQLITQFNQSIDSKGGWLVLSIALLLVPINWLIESKKWKILVNQFQNFSTKESIYSVLSGVSVAIMTPGRLGEYGGRLIGIQPKNRSKAILGNLISSLSQNIINIGIGLVGSLIFVYQYMPLQLNIFLAFVFIAACIITVMLLVFFRIDLLHSLFHYLPNWKWILKISESISSFKKMNIHTLYSILLVAFFRYSIYLSQYVLLLFFFGVTDDLIAAVLGVSTIFFLQSNLPLPPALSVLARGEMAIFLWSVFSTNVLGIIAASFTLWIINLVFPAILGAIIISQSRLFEE